MSTTDLGKFYSKTPSSSSTIHGFKIRTELSYVQEGPGKTRVSWDFFATYDHNASYPATSTKARATIKISFTSTDDSTFSEITGNSYDSGSGNYVAFRSGTEGTQKKLKSGSVLVTHNQNGKATFKISANVAIGGYDCDKTATFTLPDNVPYTACGAPTLVSASGIITPNGSFTINWSGATNGVSNNIKAYQVYWHITSDGTAPTTSTHSGTKWVDVTDGTTSGSCTIKLNNATRGHKVVCGVKALSELDESAYDSNIATGGLVTINFLPKAPTVSVNKTVVPSTNGQVTFIVTPGSDDDSSQTKTLYYSTSSTGSKTKITSPWSPIVSATTTYYFWTYDGLEFSSSPSAGITITKNTKPKFDVSISAQKLASINNNSGYDYTIAPTISISNISGGQNNKKYTYKLLYGPNASTTLSKTIYENVTETEIEITDIRKEGIGHEANGAYYRISVWCDDGIEQSDIKTTDIRYVTKVPTLIGVYNSSNFSNIEGFYSGNFATHYSKYLGFVFQKDAGYNTLYFKNYNNEAIETVNLNTNDSDTRGSWTNSDNPTSSTYYNLFYQVGYKKDATEGYTQLEKEYNITKIGTVSLTSFGFSLSKESYKFFTDSNVYKNTVGHNGSLSLDYGLSSKLSSNNFFAKIYTNNAWSNPINISPEEEDGSTIGFDLKASSIANAVSDLFNTAQKNNSYNSTIRLFIKNDFEDESYIDSNFIIDFKEIDENLKLTSKDIHPDLESKEIHTLENWLYLKEGMKLIGNFTITSYNTNPKGEIQVCRDGENKWTALKTFSFSPSKVGEASPDNPITYTVSNFEVQSIEEISKPTYNVSYQLIITTDAGSKTCSLYNNIPVRGHVPAILTILSSSYNGTNLEIGYNITSFGADITDLKLGNDKAISLYLDGESAAKSIYIDNSSNYFSSSSKNATFIYDFSNSESSLVKLGISTILGTYLETDASKSTPYFETTKTSNLNSIDAVAIFNNLPTVAYRKNHLGINVLNPSPSGKEDAIIVIGEASGRDTIYFQSATNNFCKIKNFSIDCGTWK